MRFLRFLLREFFLHGVVFAIAGTIALSALYLLSIGAPLASFGAAGRSFLLLLSGSQDFSTAHPGFSAGAIIASGAAVTLPLALASLIILCVCALCQAAYATSALVLRSQHGRGTAEIIKRLSGFVSAALACLPLFVGFWVIGSGFGSPPFLLIALATVLLGGLGWDAARFLMADMGRQSATTHATVFTTLGQPLGMVFPLPGSLSGYLLSSCLPRFIPYLAGKVPAIIGAVTVAEIVFSFPGLGSTLLEALLSRNSDLLIASVFILLCVNAIVAFIVKSILFMMYPRWYEKSV